MKLSFLDKTKLDQLEQIEISYHELKEKYHIAEQLEEQLKELNKNYNEKVRELEQQNDLFEKLKFDYERQHLYLIERDENIRLLKLELEEYKQPEKNQRIEELQKQLTTLNIEYEELQIQMKDEKTKLTNEINLLMNKITILEKTNVDQIERQNSDSNENVQVSWIFSLLKKETHVFFSFPRN
jgi:hypothetical protein